MLYHLRLLALCTILVPIGASAEPPSIIDSLDVSGFMATGPEGIVFDPRSGNLFAVTSSTPVVGDRFSSVYEFTTRGVLVNKWQLPVEEAEGITLLPNGNLLFTDSQTAGAVHEYTTSGRQAPAGLSFALHPPSDDADGIIYHTPSGTFFVVDEERQTVFQFSADGSSSSVAFRTSSPPLPAGFTSPEGITFDPLTGNLLIVDTIYGSATLYEVTTKGALVSTLFLGFDAEGITIDPATRTLYIADDDGRRVYLVPAPDPAINSPGAVTTVSAAGFTSPVAPASIATAFVEASADPNSSPGYVTAPPSLDSVSVKIIDSVKAEFVPLLFFAGSNQINLYIDDAAAEGEATIRIYKGELEIGAGTFEIRYVAPAIFFVGDKVAAAFALTVNADSSRTQEETFDGTLAPRGIRLGPDGADVYLLLFGTGIRAGADNVTATVAGESVPVLGAVAHSTFMGLDQVNIGPLPRTLAGRGVVNIVLTVDGVHSNEVRIKLD